jgi:hypothetical protein
MLARGGDAFGPESTLALYAALDRIGIPSLLVDHKSKRADDNGDQGPFGSVSNFNSLRLAWGTRTQPTADGADIRLRKVKANYHGALKDHAWQLKFGENNRTARFTAVDATLVLPGGDATTTDKIMGALRRAGMAGQTVKDLAREFSISDATVRARLSELKRQNKADLMGGVWLADDMQEEAPF